MGEGGIRLAVAAVVVLGCSDGGDQGGMRADRDAEVPSAAGSGSNADASIAARADAAASGTGSSQRTDSGAGAASDGGDGGGGAPEDACAADALRDPGAADVYYVAIDEPGADDDACDGRAPRDEGDGHCPFKDFDSERTRALLDGAAGTRVELRAGTYVVRGWDGLRITGTGTSEAERVVLSAYPGEHPVLDVGAPDGQGCTEATARSQPECVREVLRVSGTYTLVQGLTVQNGLAYHIEVTGGAHHVLRCNTLHETVVFAMRSDMMKIDGEANDVQVLHNDFSRFRSQAIDMTDVSEILIEDNEFHDPIDADAGATGTKLGARGVTIRGNRVHDMGAAKGMHAFSLGGTGTTHDDDHEAYDVHLIGNQVWNIAGILAQLVSCAECSVEDNALWNAGAGVRLSSAATGSPECAAAAGGCRPNEGTRIQGNRMRALDGGGDAAQANVFVYADEGETGGLAAADNLYCAPAAGDARFGLHGELIDFASWQAGTGSDDSSLTRPDADPSCRF